MKSFTMIVVAVALTSPVCAQPLGSGIPLNEDAKTLTPEQAEKRKAADDAYRAALKRIPDAKPADPWGNVRDPSPDKNVRQKAAATPKNTGASAK